MNILRLPAVKARTGLSRSTIYLRISQGKFPKPIKLGERASGWPSYEPKAITAARIAGSSDDEIRTLVKWLLDFRITVASKSDEEIRAEVADFIMTLKHAA